MSDSAVFREVTDDNLREIVRMSDTLTPSQQRCVAPNAVSVAQGLWTGAWFRGIYVGEDPIGFIMVSMHNPKTTTRDQPSAFLWRFMITKPRQRQGFGRIVLDMLVEYLRTCGYATLYTSCVTTEVEGPIEFYLQYGFEDTGTQGEDGEQVLRFELDTPVSSRTLFSPVAPRIALITVWTDEPEPMKRFYRDVLRFPVKNDLGDYVELESPGVRFAICRRTVMAKHSTEFSRPARGQAFELAFPCATPDQVDEAYETLTNNGALPVAAPQDMPWGQRTALFADPDGNIHEVFASLA
ncbi:MAG: GNAT family N-acetyltransferase [Alkalispirochaeta sp.]